ncbi:MAG TPA: aminotransferase class V-fold PLP-dependent enzyme, partial [Vicinamibacteria bacterium]
MRELLQDAARRAASFLEELPARSVEPSRDAVAGLQKLRFPLPEDSVSPEKVLALLDEIGSPAAVATAGPRYFGFVTGTTMGNFSGLVAARHQLLTRAGWDVERNGLFRAPEIRVVVGAEVHASLLKALGLLGLGRSRVTTIPVDGKGRMRADALESRFLEGPTIVCLQAGNVNTGAFDPIAEIVPRAREAGAWVHVDGAFGLWAAVSPRTRRFTEGIEEVDSIATDLHKWLNVPYDNGLALYRDPAVARAALAITAAYLPQTDERTPS